MATRWKVVKKVNGKWVSLFAEGEYRLKYEEGKTTKAPEPTLLYTFRTKGEAEEYGERKRGYAVVSGYPLAVAKLETKDRAFVSFRFPAHYQEYSIGGFWYQFSMWGRKAFRREGRRDQQVYFYPKAKVVEIQTLPKR